MADLASFLRLLINFTGLYLEVNTIWSFEFAYFYVHLSQEIPPCWYKRITKTMQLWIISLAQASVIEGCFYLEIYSLTILLQYLIPKINN